MLNYLAPLISSFIQHGSCRYHIKPRRQPLASAALERLGFDTNHNDDFEHFTDAEDNFCCSGRQIDRELPPDDGGALFTSIGEPCPHCFEGRLEGEVTVRRPSCHMRSSSSNNRVVACSSNNNNNTNYDSNNSNTMDITGKDETIHSMQAAVGDNSGFCTRTNSVNVLGVGGVQNPLSCSSCSCACGLLYDSHAMGSACASTTVAGCHYNRHIQYQCINSCSTTRNCLSCTKASGTEAQLKHHHHHPHWPQSEIAASAVFSTSSSVISNSCTAVRSTAAHQMPSGCLFIGSSSIPPPLLQRLPDTEHRYCSSSSCLKNEDILIIHSACEVKLNAGLLMLNSLLYPQNSQLVSAVKRLPLLNDPLPIAEGWWWARRVEPGLSGPRFNNCVGLERDGGARQTHSRSNFCGTSLQGVTCRHRDVELVGANALCEEHEIEKVRPSGRLSLHGSQSAVPAANVLVAYPPNHQRRCSFCSRSVSVTRDRVARAHDEIGVLAKHGGSTKACDAHDAMYLTNTTGGMRADEGRTKLTTPRRGERTETLSMPSLYSDGVHTSAVEENSDVAGQRGITRGADEVERQPLLFSCATSASAALESASRGVHDTGGDYGGCNCAFGSSVRSVQSVSYICGGDAMARVLGGAEDASSRAPSGRHVQNCSNHDALLPNHCSNHHASTRLLAAHIESKLCGLSQAPTSAESSVLPSLSSSRCFPPSPPPSPQSPSVRLGKITVAGSLEASTTTALSDAAPICPYTNNPTSSINRDGGAEGLINETCSTTTAISSSRYQLLRSPSKGLGEKRVGERSAVTQTHTSSTLLCPLPSAWASRDAIPSLVGRTHPLDTTRVTTTATTNASTTTTARISTASSGSGGGFFTASTSKHHRYLVHQHQQVRPSPSSPSPSSSFSFPCNSSSLYPFSHRHMSLDEVRQFVPSQYLSLYAVDVPGVSLANYAHQLMAGMHCGLEVFVMALCLVERVSLLIPVCALSRHRVLLAATLVCAKSRDDFYLPMPFYAEVGGVSREDLAEMELALLGLLGFSVHVSAADYVSMLCSLRHHCEGLPRSYYNLAGRWQGILASIPLPSAELLSRELLAELS